MQRRRCSEARAGRTDNAVVAVSKHVTARYDRGRPACIAVQQRCVDHGGGGCAVHLNANRAIVSAAVLYVLRCLISEDSPLNSGVLAPVQIVIPECLLNPPEHDDPAQCAAPHP